MSDIPVPVAAQALAARVNRPLARQGLMLRKTIKTDAQALKEVGEYFVFDVRRNRIAETHIDLEDYARQLGVLRPNECLERDPSRSLRPAKVTLPTAVRRLPASNRHQDTDR